MRAGLMTSCMVVLLAVTACDPVRGEQPGDGGSSDAPSPTDATTDAPSPPDAGQPDATPQPEWVLSHTDPSLNDNTAALTVVGEGHTVYWAHEGNVGEVVFRSYDVTAGTEAAEGLMPANTDDFCECGYGGQLIAAAGKLWYFANYGQQYDVTNHVWSSTIYTPANQRGEAGWGVTQSSGGVTGDFIISVGGRGSLTSVQSFAPGPQVWMGMPAYPLGLDSSVVVGVDDIPFVFGGRTSVGDVNTSYQFIAGLGWQGLPDTPASVTGGSGVHLAGKIYLVGPFADAVQVFDVPSSTWDAPIALPDATSHARLALADGRVWLVAINDGGVNFYELVLP